MFISVVKPKVAQWEKDNPNKFASYVRSHTTGSSYLAPQPVLEITDEDLNTAEEVGIPDLNAEHSNPESDPESDPESE